MSKELSDEAKLVIEFCRNSVAVKTDDFCEPSGIFIKGLITIRLGSIVPGTDDWISFPRLVCSTAGFKEVLAAHLLVYVEKRWLTHRENVYIVRAK